MRSSRCSPARAGRCASACGRWPRSCSEPDAMPRDPMTLARFEELLDAYGGRPERWPDAERDAALALLERSDVARARRDAAGALDALLDRMPVVAPSAALAG